MTPWFDYPEQQWRDKHAVVVGAGIAGCQVAWHLTTLGWRVTLLESSNAISTGASGNLAGIISPQMSSKANKTEQFYLQAFEYTKRHLNQLASASGDIDWFDCGLLQLACSKRERRRWESLQTRNLDSALIQFLGSEQASGIAGVLCHDSASYFPSAGFINPASWCRHLVKNNLCEIVTDTDVASLTCANNHQWVLEGSTGKSLASAEVVVLCNGKHLNQFSQSASLALEHALGQTTLASSRHTGGKLKCAINHEGYITPKYRDQHIFGATYDREFTAIKLDENADQQNLQQLSGHLPELANTFTTLESGHVSVRSTSPDRLPYVGGLPDVTYYRNHYADLKHGRPEENFPQAHYLRGLYTLGGLGSRGLTSSPLCAKALSELINNSLSADSTELLGSLHPARFLIRQLKRGEVNNLPLGAASQDR